MTLRFYATIDSDSVGPTLWDAMPDVPMLLPASSWARKMRRGRIPPPRLPGHLTELAADCGGFVATLKWGSYRYSPAQYVDWLSAFRPSWAATMDFCCEPEILGKEGIVSERQDKTTRMTHLFWHRYRQASWTWVPTIQGWDIEDYRRHARELAPLVETMRRYYERRAACEGKPSAFRVGVGTLCRRADTAMIRAVVGVVSEELPEVPLHLWGVKLGAIKDGLPDQVASVDSAAWNGLFGPGRKNWQASGMTQREYAYRVALPAYLEKVRAALARPSRPVQLSLFW